MQEKADAFTNEIFALILKDLKQDQRFKIETADIREDQYKKKFPYTEMKEEEAEEIKTYDLYAKPQQEIEDESSLPPLTMS